MPGSSPEDFANRPAPRTGYPNQQQPYTLPLRQWPGKAVRFNFKQIKQGAKHRACTFRHSAATLGFPPVNNPSDQEKQYAKNAVPALIASATDIERSAVVAAIRGRPSSRPREGAIGQHSLLRCSMADSSLAGNVFPDWQPNCGSPSTFAHHCLPATACPPRWPTISPPLLAAHQVVCLESASRTVPEKCPATRLIGRSVDRSRMPLREAARAFRLQGGTTAAY